MRKMLGLLLLVQVTWIPLYVDGLAYNRKAPPTAEEISRVKNEKGGSFDEVFKGGLFVDYDPIPDAVKIASKIRTVKDLGWTKPPRRAGSIRPRHRAWGGEGELAIQDKANYDETNPNCVEAWLKIEDFYKYTRSSYGPAADCVYVALAGGKKYAERNVVESKLTIWRSGNRGSFDEEAFRASVKMGQDELKNGWISFLGLNSLFITCIIFPTNPIAAALQGLLEKALDSI